jgi:hypothetical protein
MEFNFFGINKKKEKLFLVLDIGTEAIKGLVCLLANNPSRRLWQAGKRENNKMVVLGASTQYFERYGVFEIVRF